jgi:hypothetical protein
MKNQRTHSEDFAVLAGKGSAVLLLLAATFCTLQGTVSQYSNLGRIVRIAVSVLRWVIPAVAKANLCQATALSQHLLPLLASVWPLLCFIAR